MNVPVFDFQQQGQLLPAEGETACDSLGGANHHAGIVDEGVPHETDDIADILDVGLTETLVPVLSASGEVSVLSAAAKEFKPGFSGGQSQLPAVEQIDALPQWELQAPWSASSDGGMPANPTAEPDWEGAMYAEVQLQADMLEFLSESFSDCSPDCLQVALAKSDWDLDRASAAVLSALQAACDPDRPSKPCRHLLGGECLRRDCVFSHDFATTTCRYWLQGQCLNGDSCMFLHDLDVPVLPDTPGHGEAEIETNELALDFRRPVNSDVNGAGNSASTGSTSRIDVDFPSLESKTQSTTNDAKRAPPPPPPEIWTENRISWPSTVAKLQNGASFAAFSSSVSDSSGRFAEGTPSEGGLSSGSLERYSSQNDAAELSTKNAAGAAPVGDTTDFLRPVVSSAKKGGGGGGGRKGGRGRKTRFTAISIQALMRGDVPTGRINSGPNSSASSSSQSPPTSHQHHQQRRHLNGSAFLPNDKNSQTIPTGSVQKTVTKTGLSFADVVGFSTPYQTPSTSTNAHTASGVSENARRVSGGNAAVSAWGSGGGTRATASAAGAGKGGGRGAAGAGGGVVARSISKEPIGWVSTGETVAAQYQSARREAAELARARNKLFMAATEAFRRGQGLSARDLARRGRELNVQMKAKHREAAREIFNSRNPSDQVIARRSMDLHGLHVAEAMAVLDEELQALSERGLASVRVLTGSGHHSKGPTSKARLVPAVEHYCQSRSIPYKRIPDQGTGHIGIIDISLTAVAAHSGCSAFSDR